MHWHQPYCQSPRHVFDTPLAERCICGQTPRTPAQRVVCYCNSRKHYQSEHPVAGCAVPNCCGKQHDTDPFAILDAIVAELVGPQWVGKARQLELGALLADVRVRLEGP